MHYFKDLKEYSFLQYTLSSGYMYMVIKICSDWHKFFPRKLPANQLKFGPIIQKKCNKNMGQIF